MGAALAARRLKAMNEATGMLYGRVVMGAGLALTAFAPTLIVVASLSLAAGAGSGFLCVALQCLVQRETPGHLRARVFAVMETVGTLCFAVTVITAGVGSSVLGVRGAYALAGTLTVTGRANAATRGRVKSGQLRAAIW